MRLTISNNSQFSLHYLTIIIFINTQSSNSILEYSTDLSEENEPGRVCAIPCGKFCAPGDSCKEQAESKPICTQSSAGMTSVC